jgi:hypothetical protein
LFLPRSAERLETVVMSITGHKTASMFQRYNITSGADQREAIAALAARRVGAE